MECYPAFLSMLFQVLVLAVYKMGKLLNYLTAKAIHQNLSFVLENYYMLVQTTLRETKHTHSRYPQMGLCESLKVARFHLS
jgi:hypothetical protein